MAFTEIWDLLLYNLCDCETIIMICKYQCQKCHYSFTFNHSGPVECPMCRNLYIDWINFKEILKYFTEEGIYENKTTD